MFNKIYIIKIKDYYFNLYILFKKNNLLKKYFKYII